MKIKSNILLLTITIMSVLAFSSCQESVRERLERETQEYTRKNCPKPEYQDIIILDSIVCHNDESNDYKFCYSVVADSLQIDFLISQKSELNDKLLAGVINSADLRHVKNAGLNIIYSYYIAETGEHLFDFCFTPEDYLK